MAAKAAIHDKPRQTRFWVRLGVCRCTSWMAAGVYPRRGRPWRDVRLYFTGRWQL